jgi:hypothetical protein
MPTVKAALLADRARRRLRCGSASPGAGAMRRYRPNAGLRGPRSARARGDAAYRPRLLRQPAGPAEHQAVRRAPPQGRQRIWDRVGCVRGSDTDADRTRASGSATARLATTSVRACSGPASTTTGAAATSSASRPAIAAADSLPAVNYAAFSDDARAAVTGAVEEAAALGAAAVRPEHLCLAILRLDYERERERLREGEPPDGEYRLPIDGSLRQLLEAAAATAMEEEPLTRA